MARIRVPNLWQYSALDVFVHVRARCGTGIANISIEKKQ